MTAAQGDAIDSRYHPAAAVRRQLNKVFPTHWSFLLGEIALYSCTSPLGPVDEHGHPIPLEYQGAALPKRRNKLGSAGAPGTGSFLFADPADEHEALIETAHAAEHRALTALREHQGTTAQPTAASP